MAERPWTVCRPVLRWSVCVCVSLRIYRLTTGEQQICLQRHLYLSTEICSQQPLQSMSNSIYRPAPALNTFVNYATENGIAAMVFLFDYVPSIYYRDLAVPEASVIFRFLK